MKLEIWSLACIKYGERTSQVADPEIHMSLTTAPAQKHPLILLRMLPGIPFYWNAFAQNDLPKHLGKSACGRDTPTNGPAIMLEPDQWDSVLAENSSIACPQGDPSRGGAFRLCD